MSEVCAEDKGFDIFFVIQVPPPLSLSPLVELIALDCLFGAFFCPTQTFFVVFLALPPFNLLG